MANDLTGSIKYIDTAGATSAVTGQRRIRLIQWIDDAGDMADGNALVLVLGATTISTKANMRTDVGKIGVVHYEAGPFYPGYKVDGYSVTTIEKGVLFIWED